MSATDDIESLEQALAELASAYQQHPTPEQALALLQLRHRLAVALTGKTDKAPAVWPPVGVPDLFAGSTTAIPELPASALSAEHAMSAILHHGCLLVRGVFDVPTVDRLVAVGQSLLDAAQAGNHAPNASFPEAWSDSAAGCRGMRKYTITDNSFQIADYPEFSAYVLEAFRLSGLTAVVAALFGERPAMLWSKWGFRHVPVSAVQRIEASGMSPWHQDGKFMGPEIRAINTWISLCECGVDAPGIEVLPKRVGIVKTGTGNAAREDVVGEDTVAELAMDAPVHAPVFHKGDVLLFDKYLLHRTQKYQPTMVNTRHAIESWFAGPSSYDKAEFFYGKFPLFAC